MASQTIAVAASGDDVQYSAAIWDFTFFANALFVGNSSGSQAHVWLRFLSVGVTQGATITSAILTLENNGIGNGTVSGPLFTIHCEDADNSTMPTSVATANSRALTTGTAFAPSYSTTVYTFDITAEVQAVINRGGWSAGNALSVVLKNNSSPANANIRFQNYESGAANAASLELTTPDTGNRRRRLLLAA